MLGSYLTLQTETGGSWVDGESLNVSRRHATLVIVQWSRKLRRSNQYLAVAASILCALILVGGAIVIGERNQLSKPQAETTLALRDGFNELSPVLRSVGLAIVLPGAAHCESLRPDIDATECYASTDIYPTSTAVATPNDLAQEIELLDQQLTHAGWSRGSVDFRVDNNLHCAPRAVWAYCLNGGGLPIQYRRTGSNGVPCSVQFMVGDAASGAKSLTCDLQIEE